MNILTWLGARHLARRTTSHNSNTTGLPRLIFQKPHQRGTTVNLKGHLLIMLAVTVTSSDFSIVADIRETQQYLTPYREESRAQGRTRLSTDSSRLLCSMCVCMCLWGQTDSFISHLSGQNQLTFLSTEFISSCSKDIYIICCLNSQKWQNSVSRLWQRASPSAMPSPGS